MADSSQFFGDTGSSGQEFAEKIQEIFSKLPDLDLGEDGAETLDHEVRAALAKVTGGLSPVQLVSAYFDWLSHLAISPGRREKLRKSLQYKLMELGSLATAQVALDQEAPAVALKGTPFSGEGWQKPPFNLLAKGYLVAKEWVGEASRQIPGAEPRNTDLVSFINNQIMEALSPANFALTNPEVIAATREEKGQNLVRGLELYRRDMERGTLKNPLPEMGDFKPGVNLATTPGKVIFQNELMELIQYSPTTPQVSREPVLFVPAWVMKYYIMDLSPHNSMVGYLLSQGKTVFMMSWKNPREEDREIALDDYLHKGFMAAVQAVRTVVPKTRINAVGYCIGGTLLAMGAATLARADDDIINSMTLFAAQVDFTESGEIQQLLNASQLAFLESSMWTDGYLRSQTMGASFRALRPREQVWNTYISRYYLGQEHPPSDLMAWNADGTRMPYKMHSRYLRELYMENRLAECCFEVNGKPISLLDIRAPMFLVGTTGDHIAPWTSVYKMNRLTQAEVTFLLTSGGHNAGIICGPVHPRRQYQIATRKPGDKYIDPKTWAETQPVHPGSWWPAWAAWLDERSGEQVKPPRMGNARQGYRVLRDAPGEYIFG